MELTQARAISELLIARLRPACERIIVAGSIRRGKPEVGDIEIVCIPKVHVQPTLDMFGEQSGTITRDALKIVISEWVENANNGLRCLKGGDRYMQFALPQGINLDLFIVRPPAQWGVIATIRTGPADYSHWLVTKRQYGGALPSHMMVRDGALYYADGTLIPTPEEVDFFCALNLPWCEPADRRPSTNLTRMGTANNPLSEPTP